MEIKTKNMNSGLLPSKRQKKKRPMAGMAYTGLDFVIFFRQRAPSL